MVRTGIQILSEINELVSDERKVVVRWFYEPAKHFKWEDEDLDEFQPNELVASNHFDENYGNSNRTCLIWKR